MEIVGIQKLTLLDYPGKIACTIFTNGCNFRCPFCHNGELVVNPSLNNILDIEEVFKFLKERFGRLDAVCITGGEPTLQKDLIEFIKRVKEIGYKVKLDTNGYFPSKLKELLDLKLIDCVAMDIKNSLEKYPITCGLEKMLLKNIVKSIDLIINSEIDYEFRTTVVKELHNKEDFVKIASLIKGAKKYFLQRFEDTPQNIKKGYSANSVEELKEFRKILIENNINCELRGIE